MVYFYLNSSLYTLPAALFGAIARLEIFHESSPATPFYTSEDPNLLPTDWGGHLVFHWNGYGSTGQRPVSGNYHVKVSLLNESLGVSIGGDEEPNAIRIAVASPTIAATSDRYVDRDKLESGTDVVAINFNIDGGGIPDSLRWKVYDASNSVIFSSVVASRQPQDYSPGMVEIAQWPWFRSAPIPRNWRLFAVEA
ncbi:MAG: hypothetical protein IPG76_22875 [Acidobacteria bacterium]|nr:hypothetical protein [Acidobacteriota bacterium]